MRKILPLALGCMVLVTLLAHGRFEAANNDNKVEFPVDRARQAAVGCAPASRSNGDFQISTFLSDNELSKFKYESFIFELGPGKSDTISHRHDCDVFVTVLEGTALLGQEFKEPVTIKTGEIFHEKRNVIHSVTINPSQDQKMKALVVFIRKDGRAGYTPLYKKDK